MVSYFLLGRNCPCQENILINDLAEQLEGMRQQKIKHERESQNALQWGRSGAGQDWEKRGGGGAEAWAG